MGKLNDLLARIDKDREHTLKVQFVVSGTPLTHSEQSALLILISDTISQYTENKSSEVLSGGLHLDRDTNGVAT